MKLDDTHFNAEMNMKVYRLTYSTKLFGELTTGVTHEAGTSGPDAFRRAFPNDGGKTRLVSFRATKHKVAPGPESLRNLLRF